MSAPKGNKFATGGARPGAGRKPKESTMLKRVLLEDCSGDAMEAYQFNLSIMRDNSAPLTLRQAASVEIMNRHWGKTKQQVEHSGEVGISEMIIKAASDDDLGN